MNRIHLTFWVACLMLTPLLVSCASTVGSDPMALVGKPAPDFSEKTLKGELVKLSDLKGNVVVLDFWATWCPSCQKSLPHLSELSTNKTLAGEGLKVVAIDCGEGAQAVANFVKQNSLSLPVALDRDGSLANDYLVHDLPITVVIGRDGSIKNVFTALDDAANERVLDAAIENALAE